MNGLQATVQAHFDMLAQDGNMGLAKQVIAALYKHQIQELTNTYMTLSLTGNEDSCTHVSST